ncbi:MAG TPA: MFS transporter [Candidatus Binatia bacterium]
MNQITPRGDPLLLANALLGAFLSGAAVRIFDIAMPTVAADLHTDLVGVLWAVLAFSLATSGLSLVFGRIGDIYGHHALYGLGYLTFLLGSILCGLAGTITQLIVFRFLQGLGVAMNQAVGRALAVEAARPGQAGRAQGYMTTAFHTGFLLGPSLGGLIIDYLGWRWTFFGFVPLAATGALLIFVHHRRRGPQATNPARPSVDYQGATFLFTGTMALVLLLDQRLGGRAAIKALSALVVVVCSVAFVLRERRIASPIVNLSLFHDRMFSFSALSLLIMATLYVLTSALLPFYLQDVLSLSPSFIGFLFVVPAVFTVTLAPLSGSLADRYGPRLPATVGVIALLASVLVGGVLKGDSHWILPTLILALGGLANGFFNPANSVGIMSYLPKQYLGFASGTISLMFGLGSVFGVAMASFLMVTGFRISTGIPGLEPTPAMAGAFVSALNFTFWAASAVCILGLVTSVLRGDGKRTP